MRFKLIETIELPAPDRDGDAAGFYEDDWYDKIDALKDKAQILRVTKRDRTVVWTTRVNMNGGQCDCCKDFVYSRDVAKIEGFEMVADDLVLDRLKLARSWLSYSDGVTEEMLAQLDEAIPKG